MQQNQGKKTYEVSAPTKEFSQRKFIVQDQLGQGGQGYVYIAKSENWGNTPNIVALKLQEQQYVSEQETEFLQYIRGYQNSWSEIDQPCNMIRILDTFPHEIYAGQSTKQYLVTVMEKGDIDLSKWLDKNKNSLQSVEQKIKLCQDLLKPILFLHSIKKYIHRDIKPENYMKVGEKIKLIDFGLVKEQHSLRMTRGQGTLLYSAPEILCGEEHYTEKVDIWSLACVFYEVFTFTPLFNSQTREEIYKKILNHKIDQKEVFNKINQMKCDQDFRNLMLNMLQPDQSKRLGSLDIQKCFDSLLLQKPRLGTTMINQLKSSQELLGSKPLIRQNVQQFQNFQNNNYEASSRLQSKLKDNDDIKTKKLMNEQLEQLEKKLKQEMEQRLNQIIEKNQNLENNQKELQTSFNQSRKKQEDYEQQIGQIHNQIDKLIQSQKGQDQQKENIYQVVQVEIKKLSEQMVQKISTDQNKVFTEKISEIQKQIQNSILQVKKITEDQQKFSQFSQLFEQQLKKFEQEQTQVLQQQNQQITDINSMKSEIQIIKDSHQKDQKDFQFHQNQLQLKYPGGQFYNLNFHQPLQNQSFNLQQKFQPGCIDFKQKQLMFPNSQISLNEEDQSLQQQQNNREQFKQQIQPMKQIQFSSECDFKKQNNFSQNWSQINQNQFSMINKSQTESIIEINQFNQGKNTQNQVDQLVLIQQDFEKLIENLKKLPLNDQRTFGLKNEEILDKLKKGNICE